MLIPSTVRNERANKVIEIVSVDIFWQGPGWYVRLITLESRDREKHEYRLLAPLDMRIADIQEKVKQYERPPDYLTPTVRRWHTRPEEKGKTKVHDVTG
jgi:hypothetical protein